MTTPPPSDVRVKPTVGIALAVFLGYAAIMFVMWTVNDVDYGSVQDSTEQAVDGIVVPVAVGSVFLIIATTALGWWRPAISEGRRNAPRWMLLAPVLFGLGGLATVLGSDFGAIATNQIVAIIAGVALVGFAEELVCRGVLVVGARGRGGEIFVWFFTCLMFGFLHAINAFFGQSVAQTGLQIVMAFLFGSIFYVSRRVTGTIVLGMMIHALWDAGSLLSDATDSADAVGPSIGGVLGPIGMILAVAALFTIFKYERDGTRVLKANTSQTE
ncbi:CPBP family intramembrane glutamic endopeptidase [Demequina sp. NBRC 110055]|uniref:CPBP family intramembrane glutamic endopeptidase n=1 Tax=Demequina sp. NBRC 110055 TaxID=1570344 RepID=UPI000A03AF8D|nr:CPBP family intramembrane glutamic endopeptidase [Demequina sp. NBRC 110055]